MTDFVQTASFFKKPPAPYEREGWGIMNCYVGLWSDRVFETPAEAHAYVLEYWKNRTDLIPDYTYVKVKRTTVVVPEPEQVGVRYMVARPLKKVPAHG